MSDLIKRADAIAIAEYSKLLQTTLNGDLISRADAIEALMSHFVPQTYTGEQVEQARRLAEKIINALPSAEAVLEREQPDYCIAYGSGVCGYPIEECCDCPEHEYYKGLTEVVRCKDCRWYDNRYGDVCHNPRYGDGWANYPPPYVDEYYWCKDGERGEPCGL